MNMFSFTIIKIVVITLLILKVISFGILTQKTVAEGEEQLQNSVVKKVKTSATTEQILMGKGFIQPESSEKPLRIIIPRIHLDVPIVESLVVDGSWVVSENSANHGLGSAYPGQKGNMVIFAHARENLFLPLRDILPSDEIYVLTDKSWYIYKVAYITYVFPEQTEVINPTKEEQLTLFTCSGFDDEKRLIVIGKREKKLVLR